MDLNLDSGLPLCPPPLSLDLGYDLALDSLPFSSSSMDDILMRLPSSDMFDEPFDLPSYAHSPPFSLNNRRINLFDSMRYSESLIINNEPLDGTGGPTLLRELDYLQFQLQRAPESRNQHEMVRTRSNRSESAFGGADSATDPERLIRDIRRSERLLRDANFKRAQVKDSMKEKKEKSIAASDFDCNICFEVSKEPVVTCCGHLFCWPCLYQWLYLHCDYKECPVCKGRVNESSLVPIYGRGGSEVNVEKKNKADDNKEVKIPPRPQGNRVESLRQQLRRPVAWVEERLQELLTELPERSQNLNRPRNERRNAPVAPPRSGSMNPITVTSLLRDGGRERFTVDPTVSLQEIVTQLRGRARALAEEVGIAERSGRTTVTGELIDTDSLVSQASNSSTMAIIQGDFSAAAAAANEAPPNRGGSSASLRRRGRNRVPDSDDESRRVNSIRRRRTD